MQKSAVSPDRLMMSKNVTSDGVYESRLKEEFRVTEVEDLFPDISMDIICILDWFADSEDGLPVSISSSFLRGRLFVDWARDQDTVFEFGADEFEDRTIDRRNGDGKWV